MFNFFWIPIPDPSRHSLMGKILHYVMQSLDIKPRSCALPYSRQTSTSFKRNRKHWWLWLEGFPLVGTHNLGSPLRFGEYWCSTHLGIPLQRFWLQHFQQMRCSDKHHVFLGFLQARASIPITLWTPRALHRPKGICQHFYVLPVLSKKITRWWWYFRVFAQWFFAVSKLAF